MTSPVLSGVIAPVPTPFAADGSPDLAALARLLEWLEEAGADGALVLGTTGEFPALTFEERTAVARAAAAARGRLRLVLGVGSCAPAETAALTDLAARLRYDAVLLPPPYYHPGPPAAGVIAFLRQALGAARLPVLLYHIPRLTGVPVSDAVLDALEGHSRLAGIKDSSGDPAELGRLAPRFSGGSYLVGSDHLVAACRAAGGAGALTAAANVVPQLVRAAWEDPGRQEELSRLRTLLERPGTVAGVKAALAGLGLIRADVRPPHVAAPPAVCRELAAAAAAARRRAVPGGERPLR